MSDRIHHLRAASDVPAGDSPNDLARRVALQHAVANKMAAEPGWANNDAERLALLVERIGDVAAAFNRGHTDIDAEVLRVWATAQSWAEARAREAAR